MVLERAQYWSRWPAGSDPCHTPSGVLMPTRCPPGSNKNNNTQTNKLEIETIELERCRWDMGCHWYYRVDSRLAPSQWETLLQSTSVSHWLGANVESVLILWVQILIFHIYRCLASCNTAAWASYQILKILGSACTGNVRNIFPATDFKGNR